MYLHHVLLILSALCRVELVQLSVRSSSVLTVTQLLLPSFPDVLERPLQYCGYNPNCLRDKTDFCLPSGILHILDVGGEVSNVAAPLKLGGGKAAFACILGISHVIILALVANTSMGCVGSSAIKGVESKSLLIPLSKRIKKSCPSPFSVLLIAKSRIPFLHREFSFRASWSGFLWGT
jgi:hypothetical protein